MTGPLQLDLFGGAVDPPRSPQRRNLVIEAGAGTGKTTAIVAEVLGLMFERDDLVPERIVLMTFTEKAAGEIADRIRGALAELSAAPQGATLAWPVNSPRPLVSLRDSDEARATIERHLANVDSLRSQTIHSFCQSILRSFPIEAGLDPQFKIIEGFERSLLYGQLYDAWIDQETRVEPRDEVVREWELLFTHANYLGLIRERILALLDRRDLLEVLEYGFGDFSLVEPSLEDAVVWILRETAALKDPAANAVATYVRGRKPENVTGSIDAWIAYLKPIAASIRDIDLRYCKPLKASMETLRSGDKGDSIYDWLVSHRAALSLVALTRRFIAFLDAEKKKLGVVDFDDLLLRTLALLDDPAVLARAREQFDYFFVDEFQDTDRTQARIIERLARDESGRFAPGRLVVVGDPKQSIYGFRRADPETYYRLTEQLIGEGADRRRLADQYRSDAPMVDAVNAIFVRLFPEEAHDPNVFRPAYAPLNPAQTKITRALDTRITLLRAEHEQKADRFIAEAEAIARWINSRRDGSAADLRRFAILFRRTTKLDDYLDTLERHGIDFVLPPTRQFLDRRAPVDIVAVLRAVAWEFDRGALVSAARTPYFALTDEEIAAGILTPADAPQSWRDFVAAIARLREASRHRTVSQLIDLIVGATGIEQLYESAAGGFRHLRHLEHLRAIAFAYDLRAGGSVRQFVDEVARRRDEPEEPEPALIDETENAVRIMSTHAAKGLEFDTVIIPDLAWSSQGGQQLFAVEEPPALVLTGGATSLSANFIEAGGEPLRKIAARREEAELRRLFYVAVTRARTDVVFVCNTHEKTKNAGFQKILSEAIGIDRKALAASFPAEGRELRPSEVGPVAFETMPDEPVTRQSDVRPRLRDAAIEDEVRNEPLAEADIALPQFETVELSRAEIAARRAASRNRSAGILLHRVLELWDGKSDPDRLVATCSRETGADALAVERVGRRLAAIRRSPILERILAAETISRELPIQYVDAGVVVEKRIDRLLRESDGRTLVVDYKSGKPLGSRVAKDSDQVARYCAAVRGLTGSECAGLLWYIDLDGESAIEVPPAP